MVAREILEIYKITTESYSREIECDKDDKLFPGFHCFNLSISCLNRFHLENVCAVDFSNDCVGFQMSGKGLKPEIEFIGGTSG